MTCTYPPGWRCPGEPFLSGSPWDRFVRNHTLGLAEWLEDGPQWYSHTGRRYTDGDMRRHWPTIQAQRARSQAWWMVKTGEALCYDQAVRMMS